MYVQGRAPKAHVTIPKDGCKKARIGGVILLRDVVAAVELRATTGNSSLLNSIVSPYITGISGTVAGILTGVPDALISLAVVPGGGSAR